MFWEHVEAGDLEVIEDEPIELTLAIDDDSLDDGDDGPDDAAGSDDPVIELRFSATEVLRNQDFADYSADELVEAQQLMSRLRLVGIAPPVVAAHDQCQPHETTRSPPDRPGGDAGRG